MKFLEKRYKQNTKLVNKLINVANQLAIDWHITDKHKTLKIKRINDLVVSINKEQIKILRILQDEI